MKPLSLAVNLKLREKQVGFRRGRGCNDRIFTLRNIIEQRTEWQRSLYVNFVAFVKAFDSVHWDSLWRVLRAYGIPSHLIEIIRVSTTTLPVLSVTVTSCSKSRLVSGRGVLCPQCFSTFLSFESGGTPQRIRTGALDELLSLTWTT